MTGSKYGKHVIHGPFKTIGHYTGPSIVAHDGEFGADISIGYHCLADTRFKAEHPHFHQFHELLCFVGGDPTNIQDFDAEIELAIGEEQEIHVITSPTVVSLPPGLVHCPLIVKRVGKPLVFLEISMVKKWDKTMISLPSKE